MTWKHTPDVEYQLYLNRLKIKTLSNWRRKKVRTLKKALKMISKDIGIWDQGYMLSFKEKIND